jgi:hypothetical protein
VRCRRRCVFGAALARTVKTAQTRGENERKPAVGGATGKAMTTLADLNQLWPADHNATPWVATPDGSWTRAAGAGVQLKPLAAGALAS